MSKDFADLIDALEDTCEGFDDTQDRQTQALLRGVRALLENGRRALGKETAAE